MLLGMRHKRGWNDHEGMGMDRIYTSNNHTNTKTFRWCDEREQRKRVETDPRTTTTYVCALCESVTAAMPRMAISARLPPPLQACTTSSLGLAGWNSASWVVFGWSQQGEQVSVRYHTSWVSVKRRVGLCLPGVGGGRGDGGAVSRACRKQVVFSNGRFDDEQSKTR